MDIDGIDPGAPAPAEPAHLDLQNEIAAGREVLDGLLRLWRSQTDLSIDDARRLAILVFNGARTIAILVSHQARLSKHSPHPPEWLDAALDALAEEMGVEL